MTFCPCHAINEVSTGGAVLGGSASVSVDTREGGVRAGGCAVVEARPDAWDGMAFVLALNETGNGTANEYEDRTRNQLHGTGGGGTASLTPTPDDGVFCQPSQFFDGRDFISIPADNLRATQGFTVSFWTKLDRKHQERAWYTRGIGADGHEMTFSVGHSYVNHIWARIQLTDGETDTVYNAFSSTKLALDKWYHISASWTPQDKLRVFLNGVEEGQTETPEASMVAQTNGGYLGRLKSGQTLEGHLQDIRLHPVPRGADWLASEYANYCVNGWYQQGSTDEAVFE